MLPNTVVLEPVLKYVAPRSSSGFDWTAAATIALALFTAILAWKTWDLASSTTDDIASQSRPVLIPVLGSEPVYVMPNGETAIDIYVDIRNVGRGPAIDVRALIDDHAPQAWHKAVVSPGDDAQTLTFGNIPKPTSGLTVELEYRDLANRILTTVVVVAREPNPQAGDEYWYRDVHFPRPTVVRWWQLRARWRQRQRKKLLARIVQ